MSETTLHEAVERALAAERLLREIVAAAKWEQEHGGCFCRTCNAALGQEGEPDE